MVATLPWKMIVFKKCVDEAQKHQTRRVHTEDMYIVIFEIYISQGNVATQLRCGGIRSNQFITINNIFLLLH